MASANSPEFRFAGKKTKKRMTRPGTFPINKKVEGQRTPRLPQINNPLTIAILSAGVKTLRAVTRNLGSSSRVGRTQRFQQRISRRLQGSGIVAYLDKTGDLDVTVSVNEAFGKPTLVSVDIRLTEAQARSVRQNIGAGEKQNDREKAYFVFMTDLLERAVEQVWDNPEIAPVAIRGRIVSVDDLGSPRPEEESLLRNGKVKSQSEQSVLFDMTSLGYQDEIARPRDLFEVYGAPASDRSWRS